MEIKNLIERLDDWEGCDAIYKGKFIEANCRRASRLLEEAASALEQLQTENEKLKAQVPRWIPVEERMPAPEENPVLMYDYSGAGVAWHSKTMGWLYKTGLPCVETTHWMPLPKPPKEEIL